MNVSAILVHVRPGEIETAVAAFDGLCGVEVHFRDDATGRIIVVLEAPCIEEEVAGMGRIKASTGVLSAELVYHYFAEDATLAEFDLVDGAQGCEIADPALSRLNHQPVQGNQPFARGSRQ